MRNSEYSILKSFAVLEETPGVPGLDLPGLGISSVARGFASLGDLACGVPGEPVMPLFAIGGYTC